MTKFAAIVAIRKAGGNFQKLIVTRSQTLYIFCLHVYGQNLCPRKLETTRSCTMFAPLNPILIVHVLIPSSTIFRISLAEIVISFLSCPSHGVHLILIFTFSNHKSQAEEQ